MTDGKRKKVAVLLKGTGGDFFIFVREKKSEERKRIAFPS